MVDQNQQQSNLSSPRAGSSKHAATSSAFTSDMQDRQARGKSPYDSDSETSDWGRDLTSTTDAGPERVGRLKMNQQTATFREQRMAARVLSSTENITMAAVRDDTSITATRLKYTRMLCGIEEKSESASRLPADKPRKRPSLGPGHGQG
ncbi:hypothetical protein F4808DRAFT_435048 [Astrocystis sublimbata]|nr:hypothetical protein F4808DRAFT_435048 [Astrocystis sublimbata]